MALQWCSDAPSYVEELTNEGRPSVDYVLFSLENPKSSTPTMELYSMGKGGRNKVEELLLPETHRVITGAFLASAIDERGSVVSVRRKYIHVIWVGTRVGIMVKGKVNTSLTQPFKDQFPGCAHYVQLSDGDVDDIQPQLLEKTLLAAGGAHKPTRYSFTNRTLIGSLDLDESAYDNNAAAEEQQLREERLRAEAEERRRKAAEAEQQRLAEEEAKRRAEEEARRKAEAERRRAEEERMKRVMAQEEERKRKEEEARRKAYEEEQKAAAMTPKAALSDKTLIMLISSMSGNMTTSTNQARAKAMLEGVDVVPELVDGAEPSNKELRNELFELSGQRGKYPQFFIRQKDGTLKFFGNMDDFDYYNDTGTLAQQLGGCATPKQGGGNNNNAATTPSAGGAPKMMATLNGNKILLLFSSMPGSTEVSSNQTRVMGILKGLQLPKEEVQMMDGCDPAIKDRRNELFGISGIRAKYPQLFLVDRSNGATQFVGNYDDICYLHDTNTLGKAIGLVTKSALPPVLSTLNGKKLLLLISSMPGNLEVSANQARIEGILKGLHLPMEEMETIDGCEPSVRERRNELFGISGIRAKYPQLFLVDMGSGETQFVGNFDDISYLHDTNTLGQSIGLVSKQGSTPSPAAPAAAAESKPVAPAPAPPVAMAPPAPKPVAVAPPAPAPVVQETPAAPLAAADEGAGNISSNNNKVEARQESTAPEQEPEQERPPSTSVPDEALSTPKQEEATSPPEPQQQQPSEESDPSDTQPETASPPPQEEEPVQPPAPKTEEDHPSSSTRAVSTPLAPEESAEEEEALPNETKTSVQEEPQQPPPPEAPLATEETEKPATTQEVQEGTPQQQQQQQPTPPADPPSEPSAKDETLPECEPDVAPPPKTEEAEETANEAASPSNNGANGSAGEEEPEQSDSAAKGVPVAGADEDNAVNEETTETPTDAEASGAGVDAPPESAEGGESESIEGDSGDPASSEAQHEKAAEAAESNEAAAAETPPSDQTTTNNGEKAAETEDVGAGKVENGPEGAPVVVDEATTPAGENVNESIDVDIEGVESSVVDEADLPPLVGSDSALDFDDESEAGIPSLVASESVMEHTVDVDAVDAATPTNGEPPLAANEAEA